MIALVEKIQPTVDELQALEFLGDDDLRLLIHYLEQIMVRD